jgi:signal transduction histidine kinase
MCWVGVQDQGPGVKPEEIEHLFKNFGKTSSRPTGGEKSTGLGLAICKKIIEAHHGEIGVETGLHQQGATFWFSLPQLPPSPRMGTEEPTAKNG